MPVNPLNPAVPYSITASNETADQTRQRNENKSRKDQSSSKPKLALTDSNEKKSSESSNDNPQEREALELRSQIIDSEKVIELLAHRPKYKISPKKLFSEQKNDTETSQNTDIKKFNKAF